MRIDLLITELNVGGAEKALTEIAIGMHRRDHRVRVLSIGSEPSVDRHRLVDRLLQSEIPIVFGGFDHWRQLMRATQWLTQQLKNDPPDLCQSFLFHANCLGAFATKRAGIRTLVGGLRVAESNRVRCAIEKQAIKRMTHLVCVSEEVQTFARQQLSANPQRCSVIANGVDVPTYRDAAPINWSDLGWPTDSKVALFVGRLHPQKGIDLLQQQFARLIASHPDRRLLLIGDGPLRSELTSWVNSVGSEQVQILSWQNDIAPFLKSASMVILPSRYEGMPNVILEAMAAARPVVCSQVEGSAALLGAPQHNDANDLSNRSELQGFPPGDGAMMTQLADAFFRSPESCQTVGQANLRHVLQNFSNGQMVEHYASLYAQLMLNRPAT